MTTLSLIKSKSYSPPRLALLLILLVFACFGLPDRMQAVTPPPDGGYARGNTAEGQKALFSLTSGGYNTAVGFFSLFANTIGNFNTAVGAGALDLNTGDNNTATGAAALLVNSTGHNNTGVGFRALASNTIGSSNTAAGANSLVNNTTGIANTATGNSALATNDTGSFNTAVGQVALWLNTAGSGNTAIGDEALLNNATAGENTATGFQALHENTTGGSNTAIGSEALYSNSEGSDNTAIGPQALSSNITGGENTTVGYQALAFNITGFSNTAIGVYALPNSTGNSNTALGQRAGSGVSTADNVICIGTPGVNVSNSCYIGGITGQTVGLGGSACYVDNDGKLGVNLSSRRFKTDIADMGNASETVLLLRPVTFRYKPELNPAGTPQFGLVAEEVEAVNPDLIVRDKEGKVSTVRYEAVNAMLLNEFLKEHRKVERQGRQIQEQAVSIAALKSTVAQQQKGMEAVTVRLNEQAAQIQKVSAQIHQDRTAPQQVVLRTP